MSKAMTIFGMVVAGLLALVFTLDMIVGIPFQGAKRGMDLGLLTAAAILGFLSYTTFREQR
ncbi:MAG: hypothetical protein IH831_06120 [Planctomycetes bacterium]|nr:hypothetical protein [Planctomycetota bacterium]